MEALHVKQDFTSCEIYLAKSETCIGFLQGQVDILDIFRVLKTKNKKRVMYNQTVLSSCVGHMKNYESLNLGLHTGLGPVFQKCQ